MSAPTGGSPKGKSKYGLGCTAIFIGAMGIGLVGLIVGIVGWLKYTLSETGTAVQRDHASSGVLETPRAAPAEQARPTASEQPQPRSTPATQHGVAVSPSSGESKLEIRVNKETLLIVSLNPSHFPPAFIGYVYPSDHAVVVSGRHFWVQAWDPNVLELRKNGQPVNGPDPDIVIEKE